MFFLERDLSKGLRSFWRVGLAGKTGSFLEDVRSWPSSCVVVMSMKFWPF